MNFLKKLHLEQMANGLMMVCDLEEVGTEVAKGTHHKLFVFTEKTFRICLYVEFAQHHPNQCELSRNISVE